MWLLAEIHLSIHLFSLEFHKALCWVLFCFSSTLTMCHPLGYQKEARFNLFADDMLLTSRLNQVKTSMSFSQTLIKSVTGWTATICHLIR